MKIVKDLHFGEKGTEKLGLRLISEERNFLCMSCMRVVKAKVFLIVLDDETQAIAYFFGVPTTEKPFKCGECVAKED